MKTKFLGLFFVLVGYGLSSCKKEAPPAAPQRLSIAVIGVKTMVEQGVIQPSLFDRLTMNSRTRTAIP